MPVSESRQRCSFVNFINMHSFGLKFYAAIREIIINIEDLLISSLYSVAKVEFDHKKMKNTYVNHFVMKT